MSYYTKKIEEERNLEKKSQPLLTVSFDGIEVITVSRKEYCLLLDLSARLDIIRNAVKNRIDNGHYSVIDDDLLLSVLDMHDYKNKVLAEKVKAKDSAEGKGDAE